MSIWYKAGLVILLGNSRLALVLVCYVATYVCCFKVESVVCVIQSVTPFCERLIIRFHYVPHNVPTHSLEDLGTAPSPTSSTRVPLRTPLKRDIRIILVTFSAVLMFGNS